ncbi:MAG: DEAD/DEAH box helicase, partial [Myxococcota bacterium]
GRPDEEEELGDLNLGFRDLTKANKVVVQPVGVAANEPSARPKKLSLLNAGRLGSLTRQDRAVLRRLRQSTRMVGGDAALAEAIHDLAGHPHVFRTSKGAARAVPVRRVELVLELHDQRGWGEAQWNLDGQTLSTPELMKSLAFSIDEEQTLGVVLGDGQVRVFEVMGQAQAALRFLQRNEDRVPPEVVGRLVTRLDGIDEVPLALAPSLEGRMVKADPEPILRLEGTDMGLMLSARVQPSPDTRTYVPGEGPMRLRGQDGQGRWTVTRDLELETQLAQKRWLHLGIVVPVSGMAESLTLDESAALLLALQKEHPPGLVRWAGPRRNLVTAVASGVRVRLEENGRLLALGGSVRVDGVEVDLEAVLNTLRGGRQFIALDSERIARLHGALAERLQALADVVWDEAGRPSLSTLALPAVQDLEDLGADIDGPQDWTDRVAAFQSSASESPEVRPGFQATLRPYQQLGVQWMLRLARWGLGAVLADDMGLGKTVQALAVLWSRAARGPAMVVAPTSMVGTWKREAATFAPELEIRVFHGADRERHLAKLGPGVVLVTSWGTLVQDAEQLAAQSLSTVVFDEAHAIKNPSTRRARAAHGLNAEFVVALTGTPIENHPGDLWSLMRVVTPGLLGSYAAFNHRFARPIVAVPGHPQQARLAQIVRPFLLRRTKDQVATELPAREEVVVHVPLKATERAVYESIRKAGLGELPEATERADAIQVLAVLTRLRQAACHTGLIVEDVADSSKLIAARRLLSDLRQSGHKALVFSQFVTLLDVLDQQLRSEGVRVGRIHGSVSRTKREEAILEFQEGDTQVLLLSLQAGGVGLTLTAASYVLHLDPWWNPAVQDQATDRAHRIGQDKPVTVVHLIAEDTVEVGIRELQRDKRALVKGLLEG